MPSPAQFLVLPTGATAPTTTHHPLPVFYLPSPISYLPLPISYLPLPTAHCPPPTTPLRALPPTPAPRLPHPPFGSYFCQVLPLAASPPVLFWGLFLFLWLGKVCPAGGGTPRAAGVSLMARFLAALLGRSRSAAWAQEVTAVWCFCVCFFFFFFSFSL